METAPLYNDLADGPEGAAFWLKADDDVKLRLVSWPTRAARGTVILFNGRTEYAEKYGRAARDFATRGYGLVTMDWRGQGLSDRIASDPAVGHVARFSNYQRDVDTLFRALPEIDITGPLFLLGHSMGGAIGLRALHRKIPVCAAAFTAPMWGIQMPSALRPVAGILARLAIAFGQRETLPPGYDTTPYVLKASPGENGLTHDAEMFEDMCRAARSHPELMIGGPTFGWIGEALRETATLAAMPSPDTPCLTFLGTEEDTVLPERIADRMHRWPDGRLEIVEGARHEVMMEDPAIRAFTFDTCVTHFDAHLDQTSAPIRATSA